MKKMFVLFALCALATSLMAQEDKGLAFTRKKFMEGKINVPVVYTGMLKINGWGDEGLCYNWQQTRNSYPLFLGICQPCLDCVPCDIDMRHLEPRAQYGTYKTQEETRNGNALTELPQGVTDDVDMTEAFISRARLYVFTDVQPKDKEADVLVIDLIDAYWGKDNKSMIPVMFQFFNTVSSKGDTTVKGKIGAFYQFPIYSREWDYTVPATKGKKEYGMNNVIFNLFDDHDLDYDRTTNNHPQNADCVGKLRGEDGIGLVALIGTKDEKSYFKVKEDGKSKSMPIVTVKSFTGDFFAWQYNYTDDAYLAQPQYVCRKGEEFISYYGNDEVKEGHDPGFDGKGTWYATGTVTIRRNDSATKKMMQKVVAPTESINCIPCNTPSSVPICRNFLDKDLIEYLIIKQYKGWNIDFHVDLDNDGIYGEDAVCGHRNEKYDIEDARDIEAGDVKAYIASLVNTKNSTDASSGNYYYLPEESGDLNGTVNKANEPNASAGRYLEANFYHQPSPKQAPTK